MNTTSLRITRSLPLCIAVLAGIGCSTDYVTIPANKNSDKGLHLTVQATPVDGTGTIKDPRLEFNELYAPSGVAVQTKHTTVTEGTEADFALTGSNPGAVSLVSLRIQGPKDELYSVANQLQRTENNTGPKQQVILGHDGRHKPGDKPIHVKFAKDTSLAVTARTEDFNGGAVTALLVYDVVPK